MSLFTRNPLSEIIEYETMSYEVLILFLRIRLPSDIKRQIYDDHFRPNIIYDKKYFILLRHVESDECHRLRQHHLKDIIATFIENHEFIAYVSIKNELFARIYHDHYVLNKTTFVLMDKLESMAMSWLMHLYH
jgi:hypothetical protein